MKNVFFALALCAFVAAPAFASDHGHAGNTDEAAASEMQTEQPKATKAAAPAKKKKRTAKKVVTETQQTEEAPAEATHN